MGDVTFVRGYGFPRGSSMDYAGYGDAGGCGGSCGGGCGGCGSSARRPMARLHDGNMFAPIPSMDGFGDETPSAMVLPTLDTTTGRWYDSETGQEVDPTTGQIIVGAQYHPELNASGGGGTLLALLGLGLVGAALFMK